jgi:DNA-binding transcriptional MerR regulator
METKPSKNLSTSDLMKTFGLGRNTLRLYEVRGLLKSPKRTDAGYRKYDLADVNDLKFILEAKKVGFTLVEISDLLEMMRNQEQITCGTVSSEISNKTKEIEIQIKVLQEKKVFLNSFLQVCSSKITNNPCDIKQNGFTASSCCG